MKTQTWTWTLVIVAITLLADIASGAPAQGSANVAQVDFTGDWVCPAMPSGTYADIPDLAISLTTSGGPLLIMATVSLANVSTTPAQAAFLLPAIDGQARESDMLRIDVRSVEVATFERIYMLTAGAHPVTMRMTCPNGGINVWRGWLTVYELPLIKR